MYRDRIEFSKWPSTLEEAIQVAMHYYEQSKGKTKMQ